MKKLLIEFFPLGIILLLAAFLISQNLNKPYIGHHDFNGAFFSQIARNLNEYAIWETKLGMPMETIGTRFNYYTHNVPLHPWLLTLSFAILGQGELQARLISFIFSLACIVVLYKIEKFLFSKLSAVLTSLFFTLSAMFIYFSTSVFPEPQAIFFSLLSFYAFIKWTKTAKNSHYQIALVSTVLALLTVWGAYFLPWLLVAYYLMYAKKKEYKKIILIFFIPPIIFLSYLTHIKILTGSFFGGGLIEALFFRLNTNPEQAIPISTFIKEEAYRSMAYFSKTTLFLVFVWFTLFAKRLFTKKISQSDVSLIILFVWGVSYSLVFSNAAYIHDYFLIWALPFIAASAGYVLVTLYERLKNKNSIFTFTAIIFIFLFPFAQFLQIKDFAKALMLSSANTQGRDLGLLLNGKTSPTDAILVMSGQFGAHLGVFTNYYSQRTIAYKDFQLDNFKNGNVDENYNIIVYVDGRDTPIEVNSYLSGKYHKEKTSIFSIYNTKL